MAKHTISDLYQIQSMPLSIKVRMTENRIRWWIDEYGEDGVYVSFSGGKDSFVNKLLIDRLGLAMSVMLTYTVNIKQRKT